MNILALETSAKVGQIAVLRDGELIESVTLDAERRTTQSLTPGMIALLQQVGWKPQDVDLIAVVEGPGSFTGLRIGVAVAKTFAYAAKCEVLGVNTLEVIAAQVPPNLSEQVDQVSVVLDAQRQQFFCQTFAKATKTSVETSAENKTSNATTPGLATFGWKAITPVNIVDDKAWLANLAPNTAVTGPGLRKQKKQLLDSLPEAIQIIEESNWSPTAAKLGQLAQAQHQAGRRNNPWKLTPHYYRKSAAEEKLEKK